VVGLRIRLKLESHDHQLLDDFARRIVETAQRNGARVRGPIPLPTKRRIFTVIRSSFIDKNSREQFQLLTHKRIIDIYDPSQQVINSLSELTSPAGVFIEIKH
jgi:small subunit ribosomal protein S10